MSMDRVFGIAGSALAAQLVRMNTTASNLANASNTSETEQGAYKAKRVVFRTLMQDQTVGEHGHALALGTYRYPNITGTGGFADCLGDHVDQSSYVFGNIALWRM